MSVSDSELNRRASVGETRAKLCGWAVVAGLVIEVTLAIAFRGHASWIENWAPVLADLLVALGVFGEIHFSSLVSRSEEALRLRSEEKVSAANNAAAQAIKEAAEARKQTAELERLTAWRRIDPDFRSFVVDRIREKIDTLDVLIEFERQDIEALMYARALGSIFFDAGAKTIRLQSNSFTSGNVFGAIITSYEVNHNSIVEAFLRLDKTFIQSSIDLDHHLPSNEKAPNFYIFVATRLPPSFQA